MWYFAPLSIQKLLLFVMQNSLKNNTLLIGGLYVSSLEGFSKVKYFAVNSNVLKKGFIYFFY